MKLKGKVAVVTGGARGIGRASAILFAKEGAKVVVADNRSDLGQETALLIEEAGSQAHFLLTDVTDETQVKAMVDDAVAHWGRIDILFNNAGIVLAKFLEDTTTAELDRVLSVNLKSIFLAVKQVVPHMRRQRGGVILNTASVNSFVGQFKLPVYTASKGAALLLTKSLALDYAVDNIRVNCICPGITDTPMLREHMEASGDPAAIIRERRARVPLGRFLTPQDIARAALYLVSDESDGVTGIAHVVDGGLIAGADYNANWVSVEPQ